MNPYLTLRRHHEEDEAEAKLCKRAEPLVQRLERGLNCFPECEFGWLRDYLLPASDRWRADAAGSFVVGEITIALVTGRLMTLSELSEETGTPRPTLIRWVDNMGLRHVRSGRKKLYNFAELADLLSKRSA